MKQYEHKIRIEENIILRLIESLLNLFIEGKSNSEEIIVLKERQQILETNNPEYAEMHEDKRETMKMYWRLLIILLSIGVDFIVTFQAMEVICNEFSLPSIIKIFTPFILIIIEIGLSYFQALNHRNGDDSSWLVRKSPYLVLLILAGLTVLVIVFTIQSYNSTSDTTSFVAYFIGTIVLQVALFIASCMLHVFLIRNAEAIAETLAHFRYKLSYNSATRKINILQKKNTKKYMHRFTRDVHKLVQCIEMFRRNYPHVNINFSHAIPADLVKAINMVMGRNVFAIEQGQIKPM